MQQAHTPALPSIRGIHHVGLTVADAGAGADFYRRAVGLAVVPDAPRLVVPAPAGVEGRSLLRATNAYLRLLTPSRPIPVAPRWRPVSDAGITHLCLQSTNLRTLHQCFAAAGAGFHAPPVDLGTGFLYCYARDREGNVVELEGVAPVWDDPTPWVAHVSITTADVGRLADFYERALARTAFRSRHIGPNPRLDAIAGLPNVELRAAWIAAGNMQIELIQYFQPATLALPSQSPLALGYGYLCFEVDDVAAARARFVAAGARESDELAACGSGNRHFCADPDGNLILLMALEREEEIFAIHGLDDPDITQRLIDVRQRARQVEQRP